MILFIKFPAKTGISFLYEWSLRLFEHNSSSIQMPFYKATVSLNNLYIFHNVSVNAVRVLTFLPGVRNWNTGASRHDIEVFDLQA